MQKNLKKTQIVMDSFWRHKNAAEFYNFMNANDLNHTNVESNIPITINNKIYYLSFFWTRENDKNSKIYPLRLMQLSAKGNDPILDNLYTSSMAIEHHKR
jgi:hypothetical protein